MQGDVEQTGAQDAALDRPVTAAPLQRHRLRRLTGSTEDVDRIGACLDADEDLRCVTELAAAGRADTSEQRARIGIGKLPWIIRQLGRGHDVSLSRRAVPP